MSYILSALKKAEHDRHSGAVPDLMTPQAVEAPVHASAERKPYFIGGIAVLLLLSLWLVSTLRSGDDGAPLAQRAAPPAEAVGGMQDGIRSAPPAAVRFERSEAAPAVAVESARRPGAGFAGDEPGFGAQSSVEHQPPSDQILDVAELPPSLRKHLPRLELTGHLYSLAHPRARKVILNGIALKEKQYLNDDLLISEITPDGVILDFQGRLFRLGAAQMFR